MSKEHGAAFRQALDDDSNQRGDDKDATRVNWWRTTAVTSGARMEDKTSSTAVQEEL